MFIFFHWNTGFMPKELLYGLHLSKFHKTTYGCVCLQIKHKSHQSQTSYWHSLKSGSWKQSPKQESMYQLFTKEVFRKVLIQRLEKIGWRRRKNPRKGRVSDKAAMSAGQLWSCRVQIFDSGQAGSQQVKSQTGTGWLLAPVDQGKNLWRKLKPCFNGKAHRIEMRGVEHEHKGSDGFEKSTKAAQSLEWPPWTSSASAFLSPYEKKWKIVHYVSHRVSSTGWLSKCPQNPQKPEVLQTWNSIRVYHTIGREPKTWTITHCLPENTLAGSWKWKQSQNMNPDTLTKVVAISTYSLTTVSNIHPHEYFEHFQYATSLSEH